MGRGLVEALWMGRGWEESTYIQCCSLVEGRMGGRGCVMYGGIFGRGGVEEDEGTMPVMVTVTYLRGDLQYLLCKHVDL